MIGMMKPEAQLKILVVGCNATDRRSFMSALTPQPASNIRQQRYTILETGHHVYFVSPRDPYSATRWLGHLLGTVVLTGRNDNEAHQLVQHYRDYQLPMVVAHYPTENPPTLPYADIPVVAWQAERPETVKRVLIQLMFQVLLRDDEAQRRA